MDAETIYLIDNKAVLFIYKLEYMQTLKYFPTLFLFVLLSCNGQPTNEQDKTEGTEQEVEVYSEETIDKSENLEKEAEELNQEVDEFVNDI